MLRLLLMHITSYWNQLGGAECVFLSLAKFFKNDKNIVLTCALNNGILSNRIEEMGIKVYRLPAKKPLFLPKVIWDINRALEEFQPDIVNSHHRYTTFLMDKFFKQRTKIIHTAHIEMFNKIMLSSFGYHTVAVSNAVKRNLMDRFGVPESKISVIHNGVEIKMPDKQKAELLKRELNLATNKIIIGCVGRLEKQKGHKYLIEAISMLPQKQKDIITILIIGEGKLHKELEQQVKQMGLEDVFKFLGYRREIPEILSICDFTVLPSLWEGLPLVAIESYFLSKPVIATSVSGTPEIILRNKTGLLVPPSNPKLLSEAIMKMIEHPDLIEMYGKGGYECAMQNFTIDKMCNGYKGLYLRLKYEN